jgi:hypothetical protein
MQREKVFGIGLPKTRLTSLLAAMDSFGYRTRGRSHTLSELFYQGRYEEILEVYDDFDFIIDQPTCFMYKLAFERYGKKAKYILSLRSNPQVWFESLKRHQRYAHPVKNKHRRWLGRYYLHGFDAEHIAYYEAHSNEVVRFFKEKNALDCLLVICVEESGSFQRLIDFLDIETDMREFPHENKSVTRTPTLSNRFKRRYNEIVQPIYAKCMPRLFPRKPNQVQPPESLSKKR